MSSDTPQQPPEGGREPGPAEDSTPETPSPATGDTGPDPEGPQADAAAPPRCAECGSELDADQTYCLVCGAPTPLAPRLRRPRSAGWIAAGLIVFGLGAGGLAWAVASDDDPETVAVVSSATAPVTAPTTPVDTSGTVVDTTGLTTGPLPPDTSATVTAPPPGETTDTGFVTVTSGTDTGGLPPDTSGEVTEDPSLTEDPSITETEATPASDWPIGTSGWTAVVASAQDAAAAEDVRDRAQAAGFGAKILLSDDHPGLTPGLYVVYVGVFANRAQAVSQANRLQPEFPGSYPRFIES